MRYDELERHLQRHGALGALDVYGEQDDGTARYPLLRFTTPGPVVCLITAGFHGDEQAGPITLADHLDDIVSYARDRDVGLRIYPCINPSGFDAFTRYNRRGERPNNDCMRYLMADGGSIDEMRTPQPFVGIHPQSAGPQETRALVADLTPIATPGAALDLHQDPYIKGPLTYAYTFGPSIPYLPLVAASSAHVRVAHSAEVDVAVHTDADGLIQLHDCSVTDWFWRRGTPYTAALETTTDTPLDARDAVNLIWIRGFIDLAAG